MTKKLISQITPMLCVTSQHLGLFKIQCKMQELARNNFPLWDQMWKWGRTDKHLRKDCEGDLRKGSDFTGWQGFMEVWAEVQQIPVIIYQHGSFGGLSPGLRDKEHFAVCSWARLVRLRRSVLPMFYNCPDICRQRLLINVAVRLSVAFRSNSLNPKWVIIYFRADFNLSLSLCLPDPINGRFIALRWYFPALVQNWFRLWQGKGRPFIGLQYWCLFEVWGTCLRVLRTPITG